MGLASSDDDVVKIQKGKNPGKPCVIIVNCPDKTGLGCDICRIILEFGLYITKGGRGGSFVKVENIHMSKAYFNRTTNGARFKTWQVGKGYVRNVTFESLYFNSVQNPVIIDQNYCNVRGACKEEVKLE